MLFIYNERSLCCLLTNYILNSFVGTYAYVDMSTGTLGSLALMESVPINPPPPVHGDPHSPHYNSCYVSVIF